MCKGTGIIILAGGKSSRMGMDKGLILVEKKPIIQYLINTCKKISNNITIVSNNESYRQFGYPVVKDLVANIGPMGGLYSGLSHSKCESSIVLSCDVPLVSELLLKVLIENKSKSEFGIVAMHKKQIHPLIGLYNKSCINILKHLIHEEQYKLSFLYENNELLVLDLSNFPEKEFLNLNTKTELGIFKQLLNDH